MFGKNNQFTVTDDAENQHVKNRTVCLYLEEERQSDDLDYQFLLPISFRFRKKNPNSYLRFKAKCIGKDDDNYSQLIAKRFLGQFLSLVEDVAWNNENVDLLKNVVKHKTNDSNTWMSANRQTWEEGETPIIEFIHEDKNLKKGVVEFYLLGILRPPEEQPLLDSKVEVSIYAEEVIGEASTTLGELKITFTETGSRVFEYNESKILQRFVDDSHQLHGEGYSIHPKQLLTVDILSMILNHTTVSKWKDKVNVGYIGLDTAENLSSVLRHIQRSKLNNKIESFTIFYSEKWDGEYKKRFQPYLSNLSFKVNWKNVDASNEDGETHSDIHIMISTYVTLWAVGPDALRTNKQHEYFEHAYNNCCNDALLLSVDPIDPSKITRSSSGLFPIDVKHYYKTKFSEINTIADSTIVENAVCRATLWQKGNREWEVALDPSRKKTKSAPAKDEGNFNITFPTMSENQKKNLHRGKKLFRSGKTKTIIHPSIISATNNIQIQVNNNLDSKLAVQSGRVSNSINIQNKLDQLLSSIAKMTPFHDFLKEKSDLITCCGIPTEARELHIAENIEGPNVYFHNEFSGSLREDIVPFNYLGRGTQRLRRGTTEDGSESFLQGYVWTKHPKQTSDVNHNSSGNTLEFSKLAKTGLIEAGLAYCSSELTVISGDPGTGKSVRLRQIGHMINTHTNKYCLHVQAKDLLRAWSTVRETEGENYSEESTFDVVIQGYLNSNPMAKEFGFDSEAIVGEIDNQRENIGLENSGVETQHHWMDPIRNVVLLVDAIDEISTHEQLSSLLAFCSRYNTIKGSHLLISTRPTHLKQLRGRFSQFNHIEMYNRPESLRKEFTQKLVKSWKMQDELAEKTNKIIHYGEMFSFVNKPLLLGWMCYFVKNDIEITESPSAFYSAIFDAALQHNRAKDLIRRDSALQEKILEICHGIAFFDLLDEHMTEGIYSFKTQESRMKFLADYLLNADLGVHLEELFQHIFENLSLLFISGEGELGWTHEHLREYAAAMYYLRVKDGDVPEFGIDTDELLKLFDDTVLTSKVYCAEVIDAHNLLVDKYVIEWAKPIKFLLEQISIRPKIPEWRLWRSLHMNVVKVDLSDREPDHSFLPILERIVGLVLDGIYQKGLISDPENIYLAGGGYLPELCYCFLTDDELFEIFQPHAQRFDLEIEEFNIESIQLLFVRTFIDHFLRAMDFSKDTKLNRKKEKINQSDYESFMKSMPKTETSWLPEPAISLESWYNFIETEKVENSVQRAILVELRERYVDVAKLNSGSRLLKEKDNVMRTKNLDDVFSEVIFSSAGAQVITLETQPMDEIELEESFLDAILSENNEFFFRIVFATNIAWGESHI
ncbi:MAG: NACHT domain-containing protein, partial [Candidatus Poseidoniaceae archaeon]